MRVFFNWFLQMSIFLYAYVFWPQNYSHWYFAWNWYFINTVKLSTVKTIHFRSPTANFNEIKSRYKDVSHKTRMWFYLQNFTVLLVPLFHNFQEQLFYDKRVTNCPSFHYFERIQPSNKVNGVHLGYLTCDVDNSAVRYL